MKLKIGDFDGFIAIVNNEKYKYFYNEKWVFDELAKHFVNEMNKNKLLIWRTNIERGNYTIEFTFNQSDKKSFREFNGYLEVTNNKIYLTEYAALSMAASYKDFRIPQNHQSDLFFEIPNGIYKTIVRQLFEDDISETPEDAPHFEIIFKESITEEKNNFQNIQWYL